MKNYKNIIAYLGQGKSKPLFKQLDPRFIVADPGDTAAIENIKKNLKIKDWKGMPGTYGVTSFLHVVGAERGKVQASPIDTRSAESGGFNIKWESLTSRQLIYDTISDTLIVNHVPNEIPAKEIGSMFLKGKFPKK